MKAEYELERGMAPQANGDERVIEADLFGEGEWLKDTSVTPSHWELKFDRGVATYPLPQQTVYRREREMRFIYSHGAVLTWRTCWFGELGATRKSTNCCKHTAILGSTKQGVGYCGRVTIGSGTRGNGI
jgi:hypothetical protein